MSERTNRNYRRWYERHREAHLKALRQRRDTDPDFAERRRKSAYKYLEQNRNEINAKIKDRMATDPEFAASKKAYDADYWQKLQAGHAPQPLPIHRATERLYRQSETARLAGCSAAGIIKWIRHGWLPEPYKENGRRLFTGEQVHLVAWFKSINPHDFDARSETSKIIFEQW